MVDEFGGEHEAPFTVRVCTPELCRELLELPNTGVNGFASAGMGVGALLMVVVGALVVIRRRGMNATPATRKSEV